MQFTDIDTDEYLIEGVIRWDPPADEAQLSREASGKSGFGPNAQGFLVGIGILPCEREAMAR